MFRSVRTLSNAALLVVLSFGFMFILIVMKQKECVLKNSMDSVRRLASERREQESPVEPVCNKEEFLCGIRSQNTNVMSADRLQDLKLEFHNMVRKRNTTLCPVHKNFGKGVVHEAFFVCLSTPFAPPPNLCLGYGFGVGGDWTFDEGLAEYGCEVHAFDPSIGLKDHDRKPNLHFHAIGLWGEDMTSSRGWPLYRFSTIRKKLGHSGRIIDVLKVNIERAEYPFLRDVVDREPGQLDTVRQLILSFHSPVLRPNIVNASHLVEMIHYARRLEAAGFKLYQYRDINNCCAVFTKIMPQGVTELCCYETYYVNTRFLK